MKIEGDIRRKIQAVYWPEGEHIVSGGARGDLWFESTYHGDRDEHWIIQVMGGKEIARHNPRYVGTIMWADDE